MRLSTALQELSASNNLQRMPESSTNIESKGRKDNLKRRSSTSQNKHIEANVEVVAGAIRAKTDKTRICPDVSGFN